MLPLVQCVLAYIRKHDLLRAGDRVGVAVSGGADSVGLLRMLLELRQELGIVPSVVHLNHSLRGAESDADEHFVRELAQENGLEFFAETCDIKEYAGQHKLTLEAAARELRYKFFERLLCDGKVAKIATAHTLDDQAETVLLKMLRGAGTRGLAGIYPKLIIPQPAVDSSTQRSVHSSQPEKSIIRPFLAIRHAEVENHLRDLSQPWREDSSNRDLRHTRNRIRHEVLPLLQALNPAVRETLSEVAEIARAEESYWSQEVLRLLPLATASLDRGGIQIGGPVYHEAPLALKRRLVRAAAHSIGLDLEFRHIDTLLTEQNRGRMQLSANWAALQDADKIQIEPTSPAPANYEYRLPLPGETVVPELESVFHAGFSPAPCDGSERNLADSRAVTSPLVIRNWRPGDRFWPAHSKQESKVKELLQDRHITGDVKKQWPVIACGNKVIWMRGFGVHREFLSSNGNGVLIREVQRQAESGS